MFASEHLHMRVDDLITASQTHPRLYTVPRVGMAPKHLAVIALSLVLAGCGTMATVNREPATGYRGKMIYSGVRHDIKYIFERTDCTIPFLVPVTSLIDLPFSLLADTLCLPYTVYRGISDPRIIYVHIPGLPDGGYHLGSDVKSEERWCVTRSNICSVLTNIHGRSNSVWVRVYGKGPECAEDFGIIYKTVNSNAALLLYLPPHGEERNLMTEYLKSKNSATNPATVAPR
jgi:uncharacterized protein YceK